MENGWVTWGAWSRSVRSGHAGLVLACGANQCGRGVCRHAWPWLTHFLASWLVHVIDRWVHHLGWWIYICMYIYDESILSICWATNVVTHMPSYWVVLTPATLSSTPMRSTVWSPLILGDDEPSTTSTSEVMVPPPSIATEVFYADEVATLPRSSVPPSLILTAVPRHLSTWINVPVHRSTSPPSSHDHSGQLRFNLGRRCGPRTTIRTIACDGAVTMIWMYSCNIYNNWVATAFSRSIVHRCVKLQWFEDMVSFFVTCQLQFPLHMSSAYVHKIATISTSISN
jgi:hypothetical protein